MLKQLKNNKGFTIIEVMIVLAIAGLIILVVLLAVPALQRSSRNTAMKNDASAVAAGISEYESNNDGAAPAAAIAVTGGYDLCKANPCVATESKATVKVQGSTVVKYAAASNTVGEIDLVAGKRCDGTASTRATQVNYVIETSSATPTNKCIDS